MHKIVKFSLDPRYINSEFLHKVIYMIEKSDLAQK